MSKIGRLPKSANSRTKSAKTWHSKPLVCTRVIHRNTATTNDKLRKKTTNSLLLALQILFVSSLCPAFQMVEDICSIFSALIRIIVVWLLLTGRNTQNTLFLICYACFCYTTWKIYTCHYRHPPRPLNRRIPIFLLFCFILYWIQIESKTKVLPLNMYQIKYISFFLEGKTGVWRENSGWNEMNQMESNRYESDRYAHYITFRFELKSIWWISVRCLMCVCVLCVCVCKVNNNKIDMSFV